MKIYLVDDSRIDLVKLEHFVKQYAIEMGIQVNTFSFSNPETFLDAYEKEEEKPYLVILDIFMEGMNGIEAAQKLRDLAGKKSRLIFITSTNEFAMEAFEVYADGYLQKPYSYDNFKRTMDRLEGRFKNESKLITLRAVRQDIPLHVGQILYAETADHKVDIHTEEGIITANLSMKELDEMLDGAEGFIHCGQSFIVNMNYIKEASKEVLKMEDGMEIVVPVRLRKQIFEKVSKHKGN